MSGAIVIIALICHVIFVCALATTLAALED
jgi:hypothetical protein